jgi:hypothetical protein
LQDKGEAMKKQAGLGVSNLAKNGEGVAQKAKDKAEKAKDTVKETLGMKK